MDCKKNRFVYFAAATVNLMSMLCGIGYAWTSPCLPKLNGNVDPESNPLSRPITILESSWITSLQSLGALFGPILSSVSANKYGRKRTLVIFSIPMMVANITLIFANRVEYFYLSRFLTGLGTGCVFTVIPLYVAEISEVLNRGFSSSFLALMITSIQLIVYIIGPYVTIRVLAVVSLIPSVLFLLTFGCFVPESPYYYVLINNRSEAEKSLAWFRPDSSTDCVLLQKELVEITRNVELSKTEKMHFRDLVQSIVIRRCLLISIGIMACQQFTGIIAISSYLQIIFDASNTSISSEMSVMIVGAIQFVAVIVISNIIDRIDRKKLLVTSFVGILLSLCSLGVYFYFQTNEYNVEPLFWLPISSILIYVICFSLGAGPLPWTIIGELFPSNVKTYLSGIATFFVIFFGFIISLCFPTLALILGMAWSMWFFAICTAVSLIFIYYCVPETRGKTFVEIQGLLREGGIK